jgi:ATP-dependent Clp protease ATP-binding subunit ClpC
MLTYRFPVLIWQSADGFHTAGLVEWEAPAGTGRSGHDAREQLREYLEWSYREDPTGRAPELQEARLERLEVGVRPEYSLDHRNFPCAETFPLGVPCVVGALSPALWLCSIPTLDIRFYFHEETAFRELAVHHVRQHLQGNTPMALSRYLPPRKAELDEIVVSVKRKARPISEPILPTLSLTAEAVGEPHFRKQFSRPYEREREVDWLVRKLGEERANVLLVGEPGCGKTTALVEAVRLLERNTEEQPGTPTISKRRYWLTSSFRLIAGMKYLGQWEERCEAIIHELGQIGGVLCVDNLLDLVRVGGTTPNTSVAAFFLPYLQRGELRLVGEAAPSELDACRRLLPGLVDVFQVTNLAAFERQQSLNVLDRVAVTLGQDWKLEVGRGVVELVFHLFRRFLPYYAFPGKAVAFLAEVFERSRQSRATEVSTTAVLQHFIRRTGLPELFLRDEMPLEREEVLQQFRKLVIGQEGPCRIAADLVTRFKAGMNDPGRPLGVLLFCGPTGVGKTALARALAQFFFGHGEGSDRLIRLDMSEYTGFDAAGRLLTRPDGQPSDLIQKVRHQPFCVVLLDEIEKADAEVFDVLLGLCDEGRLTDRFGRTTTFRSAVVLMTSNLGAGKQESFGFARGEGVRYTDEALAFFRPEFFNRLDAVVTFEPLSAETVQAITRKELQEIAQREGLRKARITLSWSEAVVAHLAQVGFDARYGARPLQRTLEALVVTPLARYLLEKKHLRDGTLQMDLSEEGTVLFRIRD